MLLLHREPEPAAHGCIHRALTHRATAFALSAGQVEGPSASSPEPDQGKNEQGLGSGLQFLNPSFPTLLLGGLDQLIIILGLSVR